MPSQSTPTSGGMSDATYQTFDIAGVAVIAGGLAPRGRRLVSEWADAHVTELRKNWDRARRHEPLVPTDPLP
jgi:Domain of unknown function (DUF4160)